MNYDDDDDDDDNDCNADDNVENYEKLVCIYVCMCEIFFYFSYFICFNKF